MKIIKITSLILALMFLIQLASTAVIALGDPVGTVTGESGRFYEYINLPDGTETGVRYTEMALSGYYGSNKILRLAECDLSNTNLSIDVINCGTYTVSRTTMASAAKKHSKDGKTVLAALNGDLWMTAVNSNSNVTKKTLCTTRGVMMIDREIWATQEFGMENYKNTSNASTHASQKAAFGITDKNQPVVGSPHITVTINNETSGDILVADGLNRLPAWDSLVVYNHRINSSNYALNDSYEVELSTADATFTVDGKVTAKVVAIYPEGSTTRPSITANTIVLTARGSRVADLKSFYVGDTVTFDASLIDKFGNTELWHSVEDAIGGHIYTMVDDELVQDNPDTSEYPTSLIGIKDDGTVMFCGVHTSRAGKYVGLKFKDAYKLCRELGYNSVFYLDGGGSASFVTLKDGTYTQRNLTSDSGGAARAVINGVAMVWNDTPVCEKQGSLSYIESQGELSSVSPEFLPAGILERIAYSPINADISYGISNDAFLISVKKGTMDPYVNFAMTNFAKPLIGDEYPYIFVKLKEPIGYSSNVAIYSFDASGHYAYSVPVAANQTDIVIPMYMTGRWSGEITRIRLDFFETDLSIPDDITVEVDYMAFARDYDEIYDYQAGKYADGTIRNYYAYKDCDGDHSFEPEYINSAQHKDVCSHCEISYTEAHTYSDSFTTDIEPTLTSPGIKSRHCPCGAMTDITVIPALTVKGDINSDGAINGKDSNHLKQFISGSSVPTESEFAASDVKADGSLNGMDANLLAKYLSGAIGGF